MGHPIVHLVAGSTGAGKTTYATALAGRVGGVFFSIDAWMTALFWMDSPQPPDPAWSIERVARCSAAIWTTAAAVAARGGPVILEIGLTTRAARAEAAGRAAAAVLPVRLHWLDIPAGERWRRVEARNAGGPGAQLDFAVTREMFDFVEAMWEPPGDDELAAMDAVRVAADASS